MSKRLLTILILCAALAMPTATASTVRHALSRQHDKTLSQLLKAPAREDSEEKPIMDAPEGTLYDNMYATSSAYGLGWGDIYTIEVDGGIGAVVEGTDGNLYIYNAISQDYIWFSELPWLKAEPLSADTFVVHTPQIYIIDAGDPYYAYSMKYDEDEGMPVVDTEQTDIMFVWKDNVLTQVGDNYVGLCDATADWFYMADQHIVYSPMQEEALVIDDKNPQSYVMTYLSSPEDLTQTTDRFVNVIIDGENVYVGNLNDNTPDAYIQGTMQDGKVTFATRQYLGPDTYYNSHVYVLTGDAYVDSVTYESKVFNYTLTDQIVFDIDEQAHTLVATWPASLIVNAGASSLYIIEDYVAPGLEIFIDSPAVPADPIFTKDDVSAKVTAGWRSITFTIPTVDVDGNALNENKLYYNIYLDDDVLTLDTDTYVGLSENMTDVPFNFEDVNNFDIYSVGDNRRKVYIYDQRDYSKIGVQSIYRAGDEEHRSAIVYVEIEDSGVDELAADAQVLSRRYVSPTGITSDTPYQGINIVVTTLDNGTTIISKQLLP